ncbi:lamin tail domain-containing protein, partial [Bacteroidota bacterium]
DGLEQTVIIDGRDDLINFDSVLINIRVKRDDIGTWQLYTDTHLSGNYEMEGEANDKTYLNSEYFGFVCAYTKTRADKFFFDNIEVNGDKFVDSFPPYIASHKSISKNKVWIQFSETLKSESVINNFNFQLTENNQNPDSITFDTNSTNSIILHFPDEFIYNTSYSILVSSITDFNSNKMKDTIITFTDLHPRFGHVIINELMIDPEPAIGLPNYEYIELYNNTGNKIEFSGWQIRINNKFIPLPTCELKGSDYLLLVPDKAGNLFSNVNYLTLSSFPALTNTGASVKLFDADLNLIHFVNYTDNWHENVIKKDGGWSLEMIDPKNPCGENDNWVSSASNSGGTPGYKNSVYCDNKDFELPYIEKIGIEESNKILLYVNESLNPEYELIKNNFIVSDNIGNPENITLNSTDYSIIELSFLSLFTKNQEYYLSLTNNLEDCSGNISESLPDMVFAFPDTPAFNDIVINEILFNPIADGEDFIELYNQSEKVFDLSKLFVATKDLASGEILSYCKLASESQLYFPGEYSVFTSSAEILKSQYYCQEPDFIIDVIDLPNFPNDKGRVALFDINQNTIDELEYNEHMHFELLQNVEGVSLERINPGRLTNDNNNWHSAAETVGYATPGYQNSHYSNEVLEDKSFQLVNKVFSPDNDGFEDYLEMQYELDKPGTICTVIIYDTKGRIVKTIADHVMLENSGSLFWEGTDNNGKLVDIGIYIIYIHTYDLEGNVKKYKKTCVLANKIT